MLCIIEGVSGDLLAGSVELSARRMSLSCLDLWKGSEPLSLAPSSVWIGSGTGDLASALGRCVAAVSRNDAALVSRLGARCLFGFTTSIAFEYNGLQRWCEAAGVRSLISLACLGVFGGCVCQHRCWLVNDVDSITPKVAEALMAFLQELDSAPADDWLRAFADKLMPVVVAFCSSPMRSVSGMDMVPLLLRVGGGADAILPMLLPATAVFGREHEVFALQGRLGYDHQASLPFMSHGETSLTANYREDGDGDAPRWTPLEPRARLHHNELLISGYAPALAPRVVRLLMRRFYELASCYVHTSPTRRPGHVCSQLSFSEEEHLFTFWSRRILEVQLADDGDLPMGRVSADHTLLFAALTALYHNMWHSLTDEECFQDARMVEPPLVRSEQTPPPCSLARISEMPSGVLSMQEFLFLVRLLVVLQHHLFITREFGRPIDDYAAYIRHVDHTSALWQAHLDHDSETEFYVTSPNGIPNVLVGDPYLPPYAALCASCRPQMAFVCDVLDMQTRLAFVLQSAVFLVDRLRSGSRLPVFCGLAQELVEVYDSAAQLFRPKESLESLSNPEWQSVFEASNVSGSWSTAEDILDYAIWKVVAPKELAHILAKKVLLLAPYSVPLDTRRNVFKYLNFLNICRFRSMQNIVTGASEQSTAHLTIVRGNYLQSAMEHFGPGSDQTALQRGVAIRFVDSAGNVERGVDGGGLFPEFLVKCLEQARATPGMFESSADGCVIPTYLGSNPLLEKRCVLRLLGRILARCISDWIIPGFVLDRSTVVSMLFGDFAHPLSSSPLELLHLSHSEVAASLANLTQATSLPNALCWSLSVDAAQWSLEGASAETVPEIISLVPGGAIKHVKP
ncbi:MAG: hypothetical protein KVP17_001137 [Porospora cf. gigantea B]|nr:MAG: hypothetical protein KVP17_001137 [Porospora cf. gigantea B]